MSRDMSIDNKYQVVVPMGLRGQSFAEEHAQSHGCAGVLTISFAGTYSGDDNETILSKFKKVKLEQLGGQDSYAKFAETGMVDGIYPLLVMYDLDAVLFSNLDTDGLESLFVELNVSPDISVLLFSSLVMEQLNYKLLFLKEDNATQFDLIESLTGPIIFREKRYAYKETDYPTGIEELCGKVKNFADLVPRDNCPLKLFEPMKAKVFVPARTNVFKGQAILGRAEARLLYGSLCFPVQHDGDGEALMLICNDEDVNNKWSVVISYFRLIATTSRFSKESLLKMRNGLMVSLNVLFRSYTVWSDSSRKMIDGVLQWRAVEKKFQREFFTRIQAAVKSWNMEIVEEQPCGKRNSKLDTWIYGMRSGLTDIFIEYSVDRGAQRDMLKHFKQKYYIVNVPEMHHVTSNPFVVMGISIHTDKNKETFSYLEVEMAVGNAGDDKVLRWIFNHTTPSNGVTERKCVPVQPDLGEEPVANYLALAELQNEMAISDFSQGSVVYDFPLQPRNRKRSANRD